MPSFAYASHLSPNSPMPAPPRPAASSSAYASHFAPSRPTTPAPMRGGGGAYASHLAPDGPMPAPPMPTGPNPFAGMY